MLYNFNRYREITARYSAQADCGRLEGKAHTIVKGTQIGYAPGNPPSVICESCWRKWVAENDSARFDESAF